MDVSINHRLKDLSDEKECIRIRGREMAKKIFMRLEQLRAAENLSVMKSLPGHCHELKSNRKGQLAIDLVQPNRMLFIPKGEKSKFYQGNELVWDKVEAVEIIAIGDYHD